MSVQQNTYILLGHRFDYDKFYKELCPTSEDPSEDGFSIIEPYTDSAFEVIHHHEGLCVVSDGMNGDYLYIGKVLGKSTEYGEMNPFCMSETFKTKEELLSVCEEVQRLIKHQFSMHMSITLHVFNHCR